MDCIIFLNEIKPEFEKEFKSIDSNILFEWLKIKAIEKTVDVSNFIEPDNTVEIADQLRDILRKIFQVTEVDKLCYSIVDLSKFIEKNDFLTHKTIRNICEKIWKTTRSQYSIIYNHYDISTGCVKVSQKQNMVYTFKKTDHFLSNKNKKFYCKDGNCNLQCLSCGGIELNSNGN